MSFSMEMKPGQVFCGRHYDVLIFEPADSLPEWGHFAAVIDGEAKLCGIGKSFGKPGVTVEPYCHDGSEYPADAEVVGVLVACLNYVSHPEKETEAIE